MGLEKVNSPSTGTIVTSSIPAGVWTAMAEDLTDVISWELVSRNNVSFYYAFEDSPTHYRSNDGSGISKDTSIANLYVYLLKKADTMEFEYWKL